MSVYAWEEAHLVRAAQMYENKTGITVNIENNYDKSGIESVFNVYFFLEPYPDNSLYIEQALASLMTGSGADIYDVRYLEYQHLGKNGLLVDMSDWLENDVDLTDDIVFRDILLSEKTDDGVFAVPIDFSMRTMYAYGEDVPRLENKRMNWKEFFDEVAGLEIPTERFFGGLELSIFMERFNSRASFFVDEDGNNQNLDSEDMISLLEECREWAETGLCADSRYVDSYQARWASYGTNSVGYYNTIAEGLCTLPEEYTRISYGYYPNCYFAPMLYDGDPVVTDGNARYPEINYWTGRYGVNAGSPNAEAAQDFLRFLLSPETQEDMVYKEQLHLDRSGVHNGFLIPINRAAFRGMAERDLERVRTWDRELVIDIPARVEEAEEKVDQVAYIIIERPYYRTIIYETAKAFFLDEISAEEAARQMSDKVGLYLKEQG